MEKRSLIVPGAFVSVIAMHASMVWAGEPDFPTTRVHAEGVIAPNDLQAGDRFAESIAIGDDYIVFGAPGVDIGGAVGAGRVYVYDQQSNLLLHTLESPTPGAGDAFGIAVAIDGGVIAVGAPNDDEFATDAGAVFLFDATTGSLIEKLTGELPEEVDRFGRDVAINAQFIAVGVLNDNDAGQNAGSVELFDRATRARVGKLLPDDADGIFWLGGQVVLSGNDLIAGAAGSGLNGFRSGAVLVFDLGTMTQRLTVVGSDTATRDEFGSRLCVTGDRLYVGAERNDANGDRAGAVYGFDLRNGQELFKLTIPEFAPNDRFGSALAADDGFVVVGAKRHDFDEDDGGAVFLYRASDGRLLCRFVSDDIGANDQFGASVAIHGNRVIAGALRQTGTNTLSGLAYDIPLGDRVFENRMLLPCSFYPFDDFGAALAADRDVLVVGARRDEDCGVHPSFGSGVVYVYELSTGAERFLLSAPDSNPNAFFGTDVEVTDEYIVVSSPGVDVNNRFGAVYVFDRLTGAHIRTIQMDSEDRFENFGVSIDIDQGLLAVGAPMHTGDHFEQGAVYVFDIETGQLLSVCIADDRERGHNLGEAVSIHNGVVAGGAPDAPGVVITQGAVYLFDALSAQQIMKVTADDGWVGDDFGHSVQLDGERLVVGAPREEEGSPVNAGAVYLFDAVTLLQTAKLTSPWPLSDNRIGHSVSVSGDQLLIGMQRVLGPTGERSPSALLFDLNTLTLTQELVPSRGSELARFGSGVLLTEEYAMVGMSPTPSLPHNGHTSALFMYSIGDSPCPADLNADGALNFFDISVFLVALTTDDPVADFNGDGDLNFFDVSLFLGAFNAGCP